MVMDCDHDLCWILCKMLYDQACPLPSLQLGTVMGLCGNSTSPGDIQAKSHQCITFQGVCILLSVSVS